MYFEFCLSSYELLDYCDYYYYYTLVLYNSVLNEKNTYSLYVCCIRFVTSVSPLLIAIQPYAILCKKKRLGTYGGTYVSVRTSRCVHLGAYVSVRTRPYAAFQIYVGRFHDRRRLGTYVLVRTWYVLVHPVRLSGLRTSRAWFNFALANEIPLTGRWFSQRLQRARRVPACWCYKGNQDPIEDSAFDQTLLRSLSSWLHDVIHHTREGSGSRNSTPTSTTEPALTRPSKFM